MKRIVIENYTDITNWKIEAQRIDIEREWNKKKRNKLSNYNNAEHEMII